MTAIAERFKKEKENCTVEIQKITKVVIDSATESLEKCWTKKSNPSSIDEKLAEDGAKVFGKLLHNKVDKSVACTYILLKKVFHLPNTPLPQEPEFSISLRSQRDVDTKLTELEAKKNILKANYEKVQCLKEKIHQMRLEKQSTSLLDTYSEKTLQAANAAIPNLFTGEAFESVSDEVTKLLGLSLK